MTSDLTKIIVKVGNSSRVKFSHSKVYRALTIDNLNRLSEDNADCHITVIESIDSGEEEATKKFIENFKAKDKNNLVLFFIPNDDAITSGVADELDSTIYMSLSDVYSIIYDTLNINVSALINDKKRLTNAEQDNMPDDIPDIFGGLNSESENDIADTISNIDSIDEATGHEEQTVAEEKVIEETNVVEEVQEQESVDATEQVAETQEEKKKEIKEEIVGDNDEQLKIKLNEIEKLKLELKDTKYDYSVVLADMKSANTRISQLEEIIETIKSEKETIINRFNELVETTDILEDPIPLHEYEQLEAQVESLTQHSNELESKLNSCKLELDDKKLEIEANKLVITELNKKIETLEESISSGEAYKDVTDSYNEKVQQLENDNTALNDRLNTSYIDINNLHDSLNELTAKVDAEVSYRLHTVSIIQSTFSKIAVYVKELNKQKEENDSLTIERDKLLKDISVANSTIAQLDTDSKNMKEQIETFDKRLELANSYSEQQIGKLNQIIGDLQTKLKVTEEQLKQKETQYTELVEKSGVDSNGVSMLLESNKTLEQVNKTLREKLGATGRELEIVKNSKAEIEAQINTYKNQCQQLNNTLQAISNSGNAGAVVGVTSINPINYMSKAKIIPVLGSGSFGITTTAMSIAHKLCTTSKVLYIDFDMVTPKADAWFSKSPMCNKIPGLNSSDIKTTGLGIFFEKGMSIISTYKDYVINTCDRTKGGEIAYLSGVYYRVDRFKLTTANYSDLFNFLGALYDYIVVDLGKLGNSDVNDSIIKAITDIAAKSVVVTTPDIFEVRNFRMKLRENNLDQNRIAWLLNMCESTTLEEKTKQFINPSKFGMIMTDPSLIGHREKFTRNKLSKDKLELFINSALFN